MPAAPPSPATGTRPTAFRHRPWENASAAARMNSGTSETWTPHIVDMKGARHVANNLTREEARDRRQLLDVGSYQVELDLTGGDDTFRSVSTVRFQCAGPGADSFIELTAPAVREIVLNGEPVSPGAFDGDRIALHVLQTENELRVVADCAYSRSGEGLHRFTDPTDGGTYLYSDLET